MAGLIEPESVTKLTRALASGKLDATGDIARSIAILQNKIKNVFMPFIQTLQSYLKGQRGSKEARDRLKTAAGHAKKGLAGLEKIMASGGKADPEFVRDTFDNVVTLEEDIAFLNEEATRDAVLRQQMWRASAATGVDPEKIKKSLEGFRELTNIGDKMEQPGTISKIQQAAKEHPYIADIGMTGLKALGLAAFGPLAPLVSGAFKIGSEVRQAYKARQQRKRERAAQKFIEGAEGGIQPSRLEERQYVGGAQAPGGTSAYARPFASYRGAAPSATDYETERYEMGPHEIGGVIPMPGRFGRGKARGLSRVLPGLPGGGLSKKAYMDQFSDAQLYFFDKKAHKSAYLRDLLAAVRGVKGGGGGGAGGGLLSTLADIATFIPGFGKMRFLGRMARKGKFLRAATRPLRRGWRAIKGAKAFRPVGRLAARWGAKSIPKMGLLAKGAGRLGGRFLPGVGTALALGLDAYEGATDTGFQERAFGQKATGGQKVAAGIGGALGGTGPGLGDKGTAWEKIKNLGMGGLKGFMVGGPLGAAVGMGLAAIGGENLSFLAEQTGRLGKGIWNFAKKLKYPGLVLLETEKALEDVRKSGMTDAARKLAATSKENAKLVAAAAQAHFDAQPGMKEASARATESTKKYLAAVNAAKAAGRRPPTASEFMASPAMEKATIQTGSSALTEATVAMASQKETVAAIKDLKNSVEKTKAPPIATPGASRTEPGWGSSPVLATMNSGA